jgi:Xaa-Pro aminopeptidase
MIEDLDLEMRQRDIDGIVVFGETTLADPDLTYVAGGALARGGIFFKRAGKRPLLVVSNLDYGSAKKFGKTKRVETYSQLGYEVLLKKYKKRDQAFPQLIASALRREGVGGRVVLFGRHDLARGIHLADKLRKLGVKVVGEQSPTILEAARERKDKHELEEIRRVGEKTGNVVKETLALLQNAKERRGSLLVEMKPATIGLVKSIISSKLAEQGLIAPEGTIFAIGPSGADPHNPGIANQKIRKGKLVVFDIFPQAGSGYWFDLTRTFVVGRADARARRLFEAVEQAQTVCLDYLRAGVQCESVMNLACDVIENAGFRTVRDLFNGRTRSISSGFIHSLGHGVGLTIGERPYLGFMNAEPLKSGHVVTVEPGVYIPRYGGVRIEDTVRVTSKGIENLTDVEKELELS